MGLQCGLERCCLGVRQGDAPVGVLVVGRLGDRGSGYRLRLRSRFGIGIGIGIGVWFWFLLRAGFEFDRRAELVDAGVGGQLRVVLIRTCARPLGDHPDLIQGQAAFPQGLDAAGELLDPVGDGGDGLAVPRRGSGFPGHQVRHRLRAGDTAQLIVVDFGGDLHQACVDGVALARQLGHLLEQHLETLLRQRNRAGRGVRGHDPIQAPGSDIRLTPQMHRYQPGQVDDLGSTGARVDLGAPGDELFGEPPTQSAAHPRSPGRRRCRCSCCRCS